MYKSWEETFAKAKKDFEEATETKAKYITISPEDYIKIKKHVIHQNKFLIYGKLNVEIDELLPSGTCYLTEKPLREYFKPSTITKGE